MTASLLVQSAVIGLSIGSIYILMALGLTLMFGMMHIINFAHGAVYMLGAFVIYYVFFQGGVPYFAAFLVAMLLLGVFGYLVERGIYRPINGGIEPTLVALLALSTFLEAAGYPVFGQLDKHVPPVFEGTQNVLGVMLSNERLMIIPIAAALVAGLYLFIKKTKIGAAMRAIEQDKEAAALQGVNVHVVNGLAFAIGFALAAASGALIAPIFKLDPMMGDQPLLKAFIIIILGGLGSIPGAILGGLMLGLIDSVVATGLGAEPAFLLSFVFIISLLLFRPADSSVMRRKIALLCVVPAGVLLALLLPQIGGDYYAYLFALVFTNVILAASLRPSLTCGQLNIGHSGFMSIGAYTSALLAKNLGFPFEISLLCGALLATVIGFAIGYPSLRLRGVYFAMVTVAFVEVIRLTAQIWVTLTHGMSGLSGIPKPSILGMTLTTKTSQYYLALFLMLAILLVLWKLESSRLGLIWKSIGMADNLAQSLGVNIAKHKLLAFAIGCFFASVAGAFYAHFIRFLFPPEFGFLMATNILVYNFVGGRGHFAGPIVGAIFLSLLSEPFRGSPYETIFFSIAMLLTILFLPGGLITLPAKLGGLRWRRTASEPTPSPTA